MLNISEKNGCSPERYRQVRKYEIICLDWINEFYFLGLDHILFK